MEFVISNYSECVRGVIRVINRNPPAYSIVGLDCEFSSESTNGGRQVPALLQLAAPDAFCAIFQLRELKNFKIESLPSVYARLVKSNLDPLVQMLEDSTILKVGVGVINDANYLEENYGLVCKGCLDVRHLAVEVGVPPRSLKDLASFVLGEKKISLKNKNLPPWETKILAPKQIEYAAQDARLGVDIFLELNKRMIERCYSKMVRKSWDETSYWKHSVKYWEKYIGKQFDFKKDAEKTACENWKSELPLSCINVVYESFRDLQLNEYELQSGLRPTYELQSGSRPKYIPESSHIELCVVCGDFLQANDLFFRKAIVPVDYNIACVGNQSHYVYLCERCFHESQRVDYLLRQELSEACGAPLPEYQHQELLSARKTAKALILYVGIPRKREFQFSQLGQKFQLTRNQLDSDALRTILAMDCWPGSAHGEFVHDYYEQLHPEGTEQLRKIWCSSFVNSMKPECLSGLKNRWLNRFRGQSFKL